MEPSWAEPSTPTPSKERPCGEPPNLLEVLPWWDRGTGEVYLALVVVNHPLVVLNRCLQLLDLEV